jgi:hypothetical protein
VGLVVSQNDGLDALTDCLATECVGQVPKQELADYGANVGTGLDEALEPRRKMFAAIVAELQHQRDLVDDEKVIGYVQRQ